MEEAVADTDKRKYVAYYIETLSPTSSGHLFSHSLDFLRNFLKLTASCEISWQESISLKKTISEGGNFLIYVPPIDSNSINTIS